MTTPAPFMGGFGGRKPAPSDPSAPHRRPPGMNPYPFGGGPFGPIALDPWFAFGRQMKSPTQRNTRDGNTMVRKGRGQDPTAMPWRGTDPNVSGRGTPVLGMYGMGAR